MPILHVTVAEKIATFAKRDGHIVCGNSDYKIIFAFDSEWDEYPKKTARFIWDGLYKDQEFQGNQCPVPILKDAVEVEVGVFAGDLQTTTSAVIPCKKSILCSTPSVTPEEAAVYHDETMFAAERAREAKIASEAALAATEEAKRATEELAKNLRADLTDAEKILNSYGEIDARINLAQTTAEESKTATTILSYNVDNLKKAAAGSIYDTVVDSAASYRKPVPENALPWASLDRIGGKFDGYASIETVAPVSAVSIIGRNRLSPAYNSFRRAVTKFGVTFTPAANGDIYLNGRATQGVSLYLYSNSVVGETSEKPYGPEMLYLEPGVYVVGGGCDTAYPVFKLNSNTGGKKDTFSISESDPFYNIGYALYIYVAQGASFNNVKIHPYITKGQSVPAEIPEYTCSKFDIPAEIQALKGYGVEGNYLDLERKVFVRGNEEIDVSDFWTGDNYIQVEGGGVLIFDNEYRAAVPSEVTFQTKL